MALEVYYSQDIRNALLAAQQATASALQASCEVDARYSQGYGDGYHAALTTLALAFGLMERHFEEIEHAGPTASFARVGRLHNTSRP